MKICKCVFSGLLLAVYKSIWWIANLDIKICWRISNLDIKICKGVSGLLLTVYKSI